MQYRSVFLFIFLVLSGKTVAQTQSKLYFPALSEKMGLKMPRLKDGDYEIRVWKKCQLCFGEAHELFRLIKTERKLSLSKYNLRFRRDKFIRAEEIESKKIVPDDLWRRLEQQNVLTLPDQAAIADELHPRPQRDSTWYTISSDGTINVHAKKKKNSFIWITDGESYHFEIFSANGSRTYAYINPHGDFRHKPEIIELKKVVSILDELGAAF
ncbi:hypothetical protein [Spirosoma sp.]|uniref:hypothetical protein n=1 Tax=Spirosoma sp. TaxID=1899569 RepID=UPI003B3AA616